MVWAPDVLGSVAFLIAGELALLEFCGRLWCVRGTAGWWVAFVNAIGAVAFAVAAVAARVTPSGEVANTGLVNSSTFIGAVCFAAGAALLPAAVRGVGEGGPGPGAAS